MCDAASKQKVNLILNLYDLKTALFERRYHFFLEKTKRTISNKNMIAGNTTSIELRHIQREFI